MADLKSTFQKAASIKRSQGKVVYLSYYASMAIDRSIAKTLSKKNDATKK